MTTNFGTRANDTDSVEVLKDILQEEHVTADAIGLLQELTIELMEQLERMSAT